MDLANETFSQYFTDEMKADQNLSNYGTMKGMDLINQHRELSGKITAFDTEKAAYATEKTTYEERLSHALEPLPENATDEQRQAYLDKVRAITGDVPEKPAGYLEKLTLPDGVPKDDPLLSAYITEAHKSGMSTAQVQAGISSFAAYAAAAQAKARETADMALKGQWGVKFEENIKKSFLAFEAIARESGVPEDGLKSLMFLRNNASFVSMLFNLSRHYSEDKLLGGGGGGGGGGEKTLGQVFYPQGLAKG